MRSFCPKQNMDELKIYRELCLIKPKNDKKCEEELTCRFKIDIMNLMNFDSSTGKSKKFKIKWVAFDQSI